MYKFLISTAVAASALTVAAPASAQWQQQPRGYGYNQNMWGQTRALQVRINNLERQINRLDRRDRIGNREADRLRYQANRIERRLRNVSRNGLNPYEYNTIQRQIAFLEQRVNFAVSNGWNGYNRRFGWNNWNGYSDRDHDGRNDRYEDDQGRRHD